MKSGHIELKLENIQHHLTGSGITVLEFLDNTKASEYYIRTQFVQDDGFTWTAIVPYVYRRTGLDLKTEKDIADYLRSVKVYFTPEWIDSWVREEKSLCLADIEARTKKNEDKISRGKKPDEIVTPLVLLPLFSLKECNNKTDLPANPNLQRRLQDLKDSGYTIPIVQYGREKTTSTLLPFPKYKEMGYETFTKQFKERVIRLLKYRNAYEARITSAKSLIPDHKFPEVRWDDETRSENPMDMTDAQIIEKFQLLDNQRNQQKREVCRKCFQEGIRGTIYGINYFYEGTQQWDHEIPTVGKDAEKGCKGCPWYDIELWRKELNDKM